MVMAVATSAAVCPSEDLGLHLSPLFAPTSSMAGLLVCHASCNTESYNASLLNAERHQQPNARAGEVNKGGADKPEMMAEPAWTIAPVQRFCSRLACLGGG
jgi:hypothetical protein